MDARRRFLFTGRWAATGEAHARIEEAGCLAQRGIECRVCGDACEARALRFVPVRGGVATPMLQTAACTGCGDCVAVCPVGAIVLR